MATSTPGAKSRRLLVTRLAPYTRKGNVTKVFKPYGSIHVVIRRKATGNIAFVTFNTTEEADNALEALTRNPVTIHQRKLKVLPAEKWHDCNFITPYIHPTEYVTPKIHPFMGYVSSRSPVLPIIVLELIASFLGFRDLAVFEQVCRQWRIAVFNTLRTLKHLDLQNWRWRTGLDDAKISKGALFWIIKRANVHLRSLVLDDKRITARIPPQVITIAVRTCTLLTHLDVSGVLVRPSAFRELSRNISTLKVLRIGQCDGPCDPDLSWVFRANSGIREFMVRETCFTGSCLFDIAGDIEKLYLHSAQFHTLYVAATLTRLTNLQQITISKPYDFSQSILDALANNTALAATTTCMQLLLCNPRAEQIVVEAESEGEDRQDEMGNFFALPLGPAATATILPSSYTLLNELVVPFCGWVTNAFVIGIGRHLKHLEKLVLTGSTNIRGQFALDPLGDLTELKYLDISFLYPDVGTQFLRNLRVLETLICRDNEGVTDEDVIGLVRGCPTVTHIDMEGCVNVGRPVVSCVYTALLGNPHGHSLELRLGGTKARPYRRDPRFFHVRVRYDRVSEWPYR